MIWFLSLSTYRSKSVSVRIHLKSPTFHVFTCYMQNGLPVASFWLSICNHSIAPATCVTSPLMKRTALVSFLTSLGFCGNFFFYHRARYWCLMHAQKALGVTTSGPLTDVWTSSGEHLNRCIFADWLLASVKPICHACWWLTFVGYFFRLQVPIIAVTATATEEVRRDIVSKLQLQSPKILQQSFFRENLVYSVGLHRHRAGKYVF